MDFSKVFLERRSVRAYDDRPIPEEVKDKIMAATLRAPTAGNLMLYTVLDIEDQSLKERLAVTCDDQPFIAAQTAACAAESLGLGSCYIGDVMENWETHRDLLCLGYPTEQQANRPQPARLPRELVVQKNRYALPSDEALKSLYTGPGYGNFVPQNGAENVGQSLYARKFAADYSAEMRRSVASMLKDWH